LTTDTTADDIQDWDSLMHVTLITHVEREFGIRFTSGQVALLMDVGELVSLIDRLSATARVQP
jgi:acyl carrier protein